MRNITNPLPRLTLALLLPLAACEQAEYSDRATEIETDPPAVGASPMDSAAAGARIDTIDPLGGTSSQPQSTAPGGGS